jgi:Transposase and inactivated derivatives
MSTQKMGRKETPKTTGEELAQAIMEKYQPKTVKEMESALKEIFAPMFEAILEGELQGHLGYQRHSRDQKENDNRRNGYTRKQVYTSTGPVPIRVPRDRDASFTPQVVKKRQKDVSGIEEKVLSMYAKGMSQRDIAAMVEDIYGFEISHETISEITDRVLKEQEMWQNRALKRFYTILFVDCLYVTVKREREAKKCAVYTIVGYDADGKKDVLGLWLNESESKHQWMQIFDEIKLRGVEDILFLCMDGVSGLEEGAKSIFPEVLVQRCIVHLVRNSLKYIPTKEFKAFTSDLKKVYAAVSLKAAQSAFEELRQKWSHYPGAVDVWARNWTHVEQLFGYGSAVRNMMYTTNVIESVNSSFRKVTKKGAFPNENALFKVLYLRITELYQKWGDRPKSNWALIRNQLDTDDRVRDRFRKYEYLGE